MGHHLRSINQSPVPHRCERGRGWLYLAQLIELIPQLPARSVTIQITDVNHAMITTEAQMIQFLEAQGIPFEHIAHPPVFTCEQAERLRPKSQAGQAVSTKNLFLCDKRGTRTFLVMTACEKQLDLKDLAGRIGVNKLRFGSEQRLQARLGVTRGAVTVLGLVNDPDRQVELWVDEEIWQGEYYLCHPLVNTATLVLSKRSLERFFEITVHAIHLVKM